jgi:hypothetical protein
LKATVPVRHTISSYALNFFWARSKFNQSLHSSIVRMAHSDPLFGFSVSLMSAECQALDAAILPGLRACIGRFLAGSLTYTEFRAVAVERCGSANFVDRLHKILTVTPDPLPGPSGGNGKRLDMNGGRNKTRPWDEQEDNRLLAAVRKFGLGNGSSWSSVADFVGNGRTRSQCSQRWVRVLDPRISREPWTTEEDNALLELVTRFGEKSWMKVGTMLGNRSDVQCRYRYSQLRKTPQQQRTAPPPLPQGSRRESPESLLLEMPEDFGISLASSMELQKSDPFFDSAMWFFRME